MTEGFLGVPVSFQGWYSGLCGEELLASLVIQLGRELARGFVFLLSLV
jgi:hypothetical protein